MVEKLKIWEKGCLLNLWPFLAFENAAIIVDIYFDGHSIGTKFVKKMSMVSN